MRRPTPSRLLRSEERAAIMAAAYYRVLARHQPFVQAFGGLADRFPPLPDHRPLPGLYEWVPSETRAAVDAFAAKWRLPRGASELILITLTISGMRRAAGIVGPGDDEPESPQFLAEWLALQTVFPVETRGRRPPEDPELAATIEVRRHRIAFAYHPQQMTGVAARRVLDEQLEVARTEALRQIEEAERAFTGAGFAQLHPRQFLQEELGEGARRLFERAVLRWTWQHIARTHGVEIASVRRTVRSWASALGVSLP